MRDSEREKILDNAPYEARVGFVAFCLDRCLKEARLHERSRKQLEKLPLLTEALDILWSRAEKGAEPDPKRTNEIADHVATFETPARSGESVSYNYDAALIQAGREAKRGMRILSDPKKATGEYVSFALEHPAQAVDVIYENGDDAQDKEIGVIDAALVKLRDQGSKKPFSRAIFDGIPDWTRGAVSKKYAEGRITGDPLDED